MAVRLLSIYSGNSIYSQASAVVAQVKGIFLIRNYFSFRMRKNDFLATRRSIAFLTKAFAREKSRQDCKGYNSIFNITHCNFFIFFYLINERKNIPFVITLKYLLYHIITSENHQDESSCKWYSTRHDCCEKDEFSAYGSHCRPVWNR